MEPSICIIAFSPIYRDARVLRQIQYLAPHYKLTVIGYGPLPLEREFQFKWVSLLEGKTNFLVKLVRVILLLLGRLFPALYDKWYWQKSHHAQALREVVASGCQAIHANDWEALPVAGEAAKKTGAQLVFDAHEYAPLEFESAWYWKILHAPMISYFLRQYAPHLNGSITVAPLIAARYNQEFNFKPMVVLNTPGYETTPPPVLDPNRIKLIHHGVSIRDRRLELMIEALALCDQRFILHFMLVENDPKYVAWLKKLAEQLTPGRVTFQPAVAPNQIIQCVAQYDVGFCLIAPTNYNYSVSLPNKFFDYIIAGLAVCIGPSVSMAEIIQQYSCGCIAPTFNPADIAATLNRLTFEQIVAMRQAARQAAQQLNARQEMNKVIQLYGQLLSKETA